MSLISRASGVWPQIPAERLAALEETVKNLEYRLHTGR